MFVSGGSLVRKGVVWEGTTDRIPDSLLLGLRWSSYSAIYRQQLWVAVVVNKRAGMVSRLPLPVYQRVANGGRERTTDHPYARLLARPNDRHDPVLFWKWTTSTFDIYGEAFWGKVRDPGGRPIQLLPMHPTAMTLEDDGTWTFQTSKIRVTGIKSEDLVHFQDYNPDSLDRGMSRLEPLRRTLENEDAARRATSSFWRRGARPGIALVHPGSLSEPAQKRLAAQWDSLNAGADNTGRTVVLEEGMKPEVLQLTAEEAQYIETRKLNREEVVAAYDMPPPAVHILDHATFSNITEQFRSVYRDSMAPVLGYFEAVLESQLRGGRRQGASDPDFGDEVYSEFLMDEVLRGDFESRQEAYRKADYMTIAEKRALENLPFIEGTDRIVINAASIPLDQIDAVTAARAPQAGTTAGSGESPSGNATPRELVEMVQKVYLGVGVVLTTAEARELLNRAGAGLDPEGGPAAQLSADEARSVMGRLSRVKSLDDVDAGALTAGLPDPAPVLAALAQSKAAAEDLAGFKKRVKALTEE